MTAAPPAVTAPARAAPRLATRLAYLLLGAPVSTAAFVVAVTGIAVGVPMLLLWIGVPILAVTLRAARGLAAVERRAIERVTGRELPPHHYRVERSGLRPSSAVSALRDPQAWRDLLHALVGFPVRLTAGAVAASWGLAGLGGALYVTWEWALPHGEVRGLADLVTGDDSRALDLAVTTALGLVALAVFPVLVRALTAVCAGLARGLLTNRTAALRARADELAASRRAAVAAEATTLRRLERDLHDGPQQRLVRLTMDLESSTRRLDAADPEAARPLLEEALGQSREALAELRVLSRGIAPPILADRGLEAALGAAAARSPAPVTLDAAVGRLPDVVENAAYHVVTEALTNVAKHAAASDVQVVAAVVDDRLVVSVTDDGRGGAHPGKGHGLAGLVDRVAAADGELAVSSPEGGPTVLTARLPLRSD